MRGIAQNQIYTPYTYTILETNKKFHQANLFLKTFIKTGNNFQETQKAPSQESSKVRLSTLTINITYNIYKPHYIHIRKTTGVFRNYVIKW